MTTVTYIDSGSPSLKQLQEEVNGYIEIVALRDGRQLVVNEEGLLLGLPFNPEATALNVAVGNGQSIVGNVVVLGSNVMLD